MDRIKLGRTDLQVSPICFGCWQMGGNYWGPVDEATLTAAVHRAVELGINFFDTADAYGDGLAEEILARALKSVNRDDVVIATKVYHHWLGERGSRRVGDLSYDYILRECDASLKRLGIDRIDLYQAHTVDVFTPIDETARAFEKLKQMGKIRYFGLSNFSAEQLRAALVCGSFDTLQPKYNMLFRQIEQDVLPLCMTEDIGVLTYSSLYYGLLTGKYTGTETFDDVRSRAADFQGERFKKNVERVDRLKPIAADLGRTVTQLSLRFILDHPGIHCAIVGIKTPAQIEEAAGTAGWKLSREDYYLIRNTFDRR